MPAVDDAPDNPPPAPYPRAAPPDVLYHAVPADRLAAVLRDGLRPTNRPHVHLSRRPDHAQNALRQDLRPVVLRVDAAALHAVGGAFYASPKATWLVDAVPATFLAEVPREIPREGAKAG